MSNLVSILGTKLINLMGITSIEDTDYIIIQRNTSGDQFTRKILWSDFKSLLAIGAVGLQAVTDVDNTTTNDIELLHSAGVPRGFAAVNPENLVVVNSLADFPAPVGGVIELVPNPGDEIVYEIGALDIDVSPNVFTITNGEVVIRGVHRTASGLTTTATADMFTSVDSAFFQEFVSFTCPNARWLDFSAPLGGIKSLANQNVILRSCDSIATISGAFVTSLRTMTVVSTQTGGFTWAGTTGNQINISNFLGLSWVGALFDLGTATFNIIDIAANNRWISPAGATILNAAASNANLNVGGRGLVNGNLFNGTGTALSGGITTQDTQWNFSDNIFADGTTKNTRTDADTYLLTPITVPNAGANVYTPIAGVNWLSDISNNFTISTAGLVTYIGLGNVDIAISGATTVEKSGGGADLICCKIAIDTGSGLAVMDKTIGCTENSTATQITSHGLFTIENGDSFQLWVAIDDGAAGIDVTNARLLVVGG